MYFFLFAVFSVESVAAKETMQLLAFWRSLLCRVVLLRTDVSLTRDNSDKAENSVRQELTSHKLELDSLRRELVEAKNQKRRSDSDLLTAQSKVSQLQSSNQRLQEQLETADAEIRSLKQRVAELSARAKANAATALERLYDVEHLMCPTIGGGCQSCFQFWGKKLLCLLIPGTEDHILIRGILSPA